MDPAGIREIYLLRPLLENPYQVERVVGDLPFKVRVHPVYSNIPWLPFSEPLTQRVSRASEGYAGWLQYDCAVLAGIDLQSATERDVHNIHAAVERGLPVMLCGGSQGLGHSYRGWHELEPHLPAKIPTARAMPCQAHVTVVNQHPLLRGLPARLGRVKSIHPLEVPPDAQVLLAADGIPVLVASERCGARQLILAVEQAEGLCCDGLQPGGFYGDPFYPDLMRRCLAWLMKVESPVWIDSVNVGQGDAAARARPLKIRVRQTQPCEAARLRVAVYAIDEARLASGGDTRDGGLLREEQHALALLDQEVSVTVADECAGQCAGLYRVEIEVGMKDPPRATLDGCFGMATFPGWTHWKSDVVERRRFLLRFPDRRVNRIGLPGRTVTLQQAVPWEIQLFPAAPCECRLEIRDDRDRTVGRVSSRRSPAARKLRWIPPALVAGDYTAVVKVKAQADRVEEFRFALKAVAPVAADETFHLVSHGLNTGLSDGELEDSIRTHREEYSLDTFSVPVLGDAAEFLDESRNWLEQPYAVRRRRWCDAAVAAAGCHLWVDFDAPLILLATHGATRNYAPTLPCVYHPDYEDEVRDQLTPRFRILAERAGQISAEIVDEPHLYPSNLCRCEICRRLYRERFGEELPRYQAVEGDQGPRRWHLFQWLEDYSSRAFAVARKIKQEIAPRIHMHNTAVDRLFVSNFMFNGMHRWAEFGDEIYMACYPWGYLNWRGGVQMPHSQTHWIAAWIRGLAQHYGIPWGVFMDLWEHDVPNRWLPPFWSVGQFYALLAEGVDRLDTFLVCSGVEFFGISETRLREFGFEVNKVRPFFPLLARTARPRGRMAFINPWAEWVMNPAPHYLPPHHEGYGYYRRYGFPFDKLYPYENRRMMAYELFHRVFGDLDQVDEQLFSAMDKEAYQAAVISDCTFLTRRMVTRGKAMLDRGGVLILDCLPQRDEEGQPLPFFEELMAGGPCESGVLIPGLAYRMYQAGRGRVLFFTASLQETYAGLVEGECPGLRARLEDGIAALLTRLGLGARCVSTHGDVDAGLRMAEDLVLIPVSNTSAKPQTARIRVAELPFTPVLAVNLTDGGFVDARGVTQTAAFETQLEPYHGALYALYPSRPATVSIKQSAGPWRTGAPWRCTILLDTSVGQPARGAFLVEVRVTDGEGRDHPALGGALVAHDGTVKMEKTIPVNASPGRWRVHVMDRILGLTGEIEFEVR